MNSGRRKKLFIFLSTTIMVWTSFSHGAPKPLYKALRLQDGKQDRVLVTNNKSSYVIDISLVKQFIKKVAETIIKIYSTEIWLKLSLAQVQVLEGRPEGQDYLVLAPLKNVAPSSIKAFYKTPAMGDGQSNYIWYPRTFCIGCARPTKINRETELLLNPILERQTETLSKI